MSEPTEFPPVPQEPPVEKPKRNWRGFLKEYVVVVLGVATALAAEQAVEWFHWHGQVVEAKQIIATEMAGNLRRTIRRMRTAACVEHRLDQLAAILDGAAKTGSLPPLGEIGTPPRDFWQNGAWDSVVASQTATHFPRQQLADITFAYKRLAFLEGYGPQEGDAWDSLYAMVGPGRRLDPASEARLREALSKARSLNRLTAFVSTQLTAAANTLGLTFTPENLALIAQSRTGPPRLFFNATNGASLNLSICAPLGKAPPLYGQGGSSETMSQVEDAVKRLPDYGRGAP